MTLVSTIVYGRSSMSRPCHTTTPCIGTKTPTIVSYEIYQIDHDLDHLVPRSPLREGVNDLHQSVVQIQPRKHVLDYADYTRAIRQHELNNTDHTDHTDHTDQGSICSRSWTVVGIDHTDPRDHSDQNVTYLNPLSLGLGQITWG